jgi:uncharacterized protein
MNATAEMIGSVNEIPAAVWDSLANPNPDHFNPFVSHGFLSALEESGCTMADTGWQPHHAVLRNNGAIEGIGICYLKSHSMGEYVFDHGWADAYHRAGGSYYPKLQMSVPFTPATGPRLLAKSSESKRSLAQALRQFCEKSGASSVHATFVTSEDRDILQEQSWLLREDMQFHWHNEGYRNFDDFLKALSSGKRKNIRKERASFAEREITFECLSGSEITENHWDHFYRFYMDTGARKWGRPYLNREFFSLLSSRLGSHVVLIMAKRSNKYIAGALNLRGGDTLFGRNWGCVEDHSFLHFEVCYYQAIDFAIAHGLNKVEAGAQGEHKLARGYLPVKTQSLHFLKHAGLRRAVEDYLLHERRAINREQELLSEHAPFRNEQD